MKHSHGPRSCWTRAYHAFKPYMPSPRCEASRGLSHQLVQKAKILGDAVFKRIYAMLSEKTFGQCQVQLLAFEPIPIGRILPMLGSTVLFMATDTNDLIRGGVFAALVNYSPQHRVVRLKGY